MKYLMLLMCLIISSNSSAMSAPLGEVSQTHPSPAAMFEKWRTMLDRHASTKAASCDGESNGCLPSDVLSRLYKLRSDSQMEQLKSVNKLVNRVRYRSDKRQYGTNDYWASPAEFFANGKGDCEDYSIAKYFALRELGFATQDMRLIIAKDSKINEYHAVLSVNVDGQFYILDNRTSGIKIDVNVPSLKPIYALNENQWWLYQNALKLING
jgi:predicted transglutaminase-like cysteine proteinase